MTDKNDNRAALLADRNFRWLAAGSAISLLGDRFTVLALPWLVLRLTGDTAALGIVLALIGVPCALFILVGGAVVDRLSPQRVLMLTKHVNTVLLAVLAAGTWFQGLTLPAIYAIALALGVSTAFSIPSGTSMLPHALPPQLLPAANGLLMGARQASMFLGPLAAGLLIAVFGDGGGETAGAHGIALAFAVDALSFAVSAWTLSHVRLRGTPAAAPVQRTGIWTSVLEGLRHVAADAQLRSCYLYWAALALLVMGPLSLAVPVLAANNPQLGASALGLMTGLHGAGTLAGLVIAGTRPGLLRVGTLGTSILAADAVIGLLFIPLGWITQAWQGAALLAATGLLGGFMQVAVFTWVQRRVPQALLGRAMSLFMFIFMGLVPVASAATGWVLRVVSLQQLFAGCGAALVALAVVAAVATPIRLVSDVPQPVR